MIGARGRCARRGRRGPYTPSYCDLPSQRGARARWRWCCARSGWRCHCDSQATWGLRTRWRSRCRCDVQSGRGAMSCRACRVLSCHVASCHVTSRRVASCHLMSCHVAMLRRVMSCHVRSGRIMSSLSCPFTPRRRVMSSQVMSCHVTSRRVLSSLLGRVMSCDVTSRHVTSCHAASRRVTSRPFLSPCAVFLRGKRPRNIDTATSLSHFANALRSHPHSSFIPLAFAQLTLTPLTFTRPRSSVYQP